MDLTGASLVAVVQRPGDNVSLVLRINQKVTAQILNIVKNHVQLTIGGIRMMARLSSPEQATLLQNQSQVQFVVRGLSQQSVQLQLVPPEVQKGAQVQFTSTPLEMQDLAQTLLKDMGLPLNDTNLKLTTALLQRGITVTPDVIKDLGEVLTRLVNWGPAEMQAAISLKESGLPLTPATVTLTAAESPEVSQTLLQLRTEITNILSSSNLTPKQTDLANNILTQLNNLFIKWSDSPLLLQESLQKAVQVFGQSIEKDLAQVVLKGQDTIQDTADSLMLSLAALRAELARAGSPPALSNTIERFINEMRSVQFLNLPGKSEPAQGLWFRIDLPLQLVNNNNPSDPLYQTRLRVAYRNKGETSEVDPDYTRLIIQVDVSEGETLDVDLSIASHKIGSQVTASNEDLRKLAEEEFPGLQTALESAGYQMLTSTFKIGESPETSLPIAESRNLPVERLDVEV